jgi:dienelactone hydrolase
LNHRFQYVIAGLLFYVSLAFAGEPEAVPSLKCEPGSDGTITWWLISPFQKEPVDTSKPPLNAREGETIPGTSDKWSLAITDRHSVQLRCPPFGNGIVWASARINSLSGGKRRLQAAGIGSLKVFLDGHCVADKPAPGLPQADQADVEIDLPKGISELSVAAGQRPGFYTQFLVLLTQAGVRPSKPAPGDVVELPVAQGKEPDAGAALLSSIVLVPKEAFFVEGGDKVEVLAGMQGSTLAGLGQLAARLIGPDGSPVGGDLPLRTAAELADNRNLWRAEFVYPHGSVASADLQLEIKAGEKLLGTKTVTLYSKSGLSAAIAAAEKDIPERVAKLKKPLPNASFYIEKAGLSLKSIDKDYPSPTTGAAIVDLLNKGKAFAELEAQGKDPWAGKIGYFERAYHSNIDESAQPYQVQVPSAYNPAGNGDKKFPLVIFLHGYVLGYDKQHWWEEMPEFDILFEKRGAFLAIPFARTNTDFQSCGEVDVLDVIADMKKHYPIDDDRVYLYGYSMGAMGVFTVAAHYPDLFAGGVVLAGRADTPLAGMGMDKKPIESYATFKQWVMRADNPIDLCENLMNIPMRLYHGAEDPIVNVSEARRMEKRLIEIGCDAKLTVGSGDHWLGLEIMVKDEPVEWLLQQKRNPNPAKGRMRAFNMRYAQQGAVTVTTTNGKLEPIELEWANADGKVTFTHDCPAVLQRKIRGEPDPKPLDGLHKTPALCGPIREAICSPFVIVYGTTGLPHNNEIIKKYADRFAKDWYEFTKSNAIVKADTEVTEEDKKNKNLFLFGEEQENALHAACAKDLPISIKDGNATVGDKVISLAGRGMMYIYPSPFSGGNPRSVVICVGRPYGLKVSANHKLDLLPDLLIYEKEDKENPDKTNTNLPVLAAFFNGEWKLDPATTWWFDK